MKPLAGIRVLAMGQMQQRPLGRLLATLGAELLSGQATRDSIGGVHFLVEHEGLERLADQGVTRALLEKWNPALIHVSVTPFGSGSARSRWQGSELVAAAMGGTLRLTGAPDRAPVKEALDACTFHAEMVAAAGAMAAHYARLDTGRGQHVDVSIQEVAFSRNVNGVLVWQFDQRKLHRVGGALNYGRATVRCIWALADGWCFHSLMTGRFGAPANQALSDWMEEVGAPNPLRGVDWLRYNRSTLDATTRAEWEAAIAAFFRTRSCDEIRTEGRQRGINACVVEAPEAVLESAHLRARSFWHEQDQLLRPGRFATLTGGAPAPAWRARGRGLRSGPLAGLRILDFSWALVGSITTKILGDLGADVIKIESSTRPCLSRLDVQVKASRPDNPDDKPWFAHLNTSKRSVALDLKNAAARTLLDPLINWADAVVENFSPGTMDKLGLGYAQLCAHRPDIVMASGSVYGQTGPLAREWGVDGTGAALAGRTWLTGWADRDPVVPGAVPYGDVIVPYVMAACLVAALAHRRQGGHGCHIDASMYEICVQQMHDALIAAQRGAPMQRAGNADARLHHQDVYPVRGEDRWVAITLRDPAQQLALERLADGQTLAEWTATQDGTELVNTLQSLGIAAGEVQDIEDLQRDETLRARGALVELPHPWLGAFGHVRTPISFSSEQVTPFRAPMLGEHGREVALSIAGLDESRYAALVAAGVLK